jgi:hypothetical protein
MKRKIIIATGVVLTLILAVVILNQKEAPGEAGETETATRSDLATSDTLPGFRSRRDASSSEYTAEDLQPLEPPLDIEEVVLSEGETVADLTPEEVALIEEQQRQIALKIARGKTSQFESKLKNLVADLGLEAEQESALRSYFDRVQADITAGDLQAYGAQEQILSGAGLESVLKEVLTEEQWDLHQSTAERLANERAQRAAEVEMSHVSSLLGLNREQAGQVQEILRRQALARENEEPLQSNAAQQQDFARRLREEVAAAGPESNPLEILIEGQLQESWDARLGELEGVLTPEQLEQYRESLVAREGDLSRFGNTLNAFQKGASQ